MSDITEIYLCKAGQRLDEGDLQISHDIATREDAEQDAFRLCRQNPAIHRVAYYKFNDSGDHKLFHSYTNPKTDQPKKQMVETVADGPKRTVFMRKPGYWERLWRRVTASEQ